MQQAWKEFRAGWSDAAWGTRLALTLAPFVAVGTLLWMAIQGEAPSWTWKVLLGFAIGVLVGRLSRSLRLTLLPPRRSDTGRHRRLDPDRPFAGAKGGEARRRAR